MPNKDWSAIGDKSDAFAKITVDGVVQTSDVVYDNNHPTFNARLYLGCVPSSSIMKVLAPQSCFATACWCSTCSKSARRF